MLSVLATEKQSKGVAEALRSMAGLHVAGAGPCEFVSSKCILRNALKPLQCWSR